LDTLRSLVSLAQRTPSHEITKTLDYFLVYENYFRDLQEEPIHLAEIGVYDGTSLKIFADYFSQGRVLGVDLVKQEIDFSAHPNVEYKICDQTDATGLEALVTQFAPSGLDIVIDDASHVGFNSLKTFEALFPRVKVGGLYIVEDWGTGYWDDWPDGSHFQLQRFEPFDGTVPKRMISHDFGMVGFVKCLVDILGMSAIRPQFGAKQTRVSPFEFLHLYHGIAVIKKRGDLIW
jgi:hypothetical protein